VADSGLLRMVPDRHHRIFVHIETTTMVQDSTRQPLLPHSAEEQNVNVYELIHEINRAVRVSANVVGKRAHVPTDRRTSVF
jgi:hypothetical protein